MKSILVWLYTSRLVMRYPWPSIMYEIIMIESYAASGNFKGSFVVSISKAQTWTSARCNRSVLLSTVIPSLDTLTSYHCPHLISELCEIKNALDRVNWNLRIQREWKKELYNYELIITFVNCKADMIRYIKFTKIIDTIYKILGPLFAAQSKHLQIQTKLIAMTLC